MSESGKKEKLNNPKAFPSHYEFDDGSYASTMGMTLRDYFAAKALNGVCSNQTFLINLNAEPNKVAIACYEIADAMLKARNDSSAD